MSIENNPLNVQIGGNHYKEMKIQPIEFINANNIGFSEGCVIKRMTRWNKQSGKGVEDLKKAMHEIELLIYFEQIRANDKHG